MRRRRIGLIWAFCDACHVMVSQHKLSVWPVPLEARDEAFKVALTVWERTGSSDGLEIMARIVVSDVGAFQTRVRPVLECCLAGMAGMSPLVGAQCIALVISATPPALEDQFVFRMFDAIVPIVGRQVPAFQIEMFSPLEAFVGAYPVVLERMWGFLNAFGPLVKADDSAGRELLTVVLENYATVARSLPYEASARFLSGMGPLVTLWKRVWKMAATCQERDCELERVMDGAVASIEAVDGKLGRMASAYMRTNAVTQLLDWVRNGPECGNEIPSIGPSGGVPGVFD